MLAIRTILHPTDFSDRSNYAFRLACALAKDHGAKLIVLHVLPHSAVAYGEVITGLSDEMYRQQAEQELQNLKPADAGVGIDRRMVMGDPGPEIVDAAKETKADMIVMGTHGRSGLGRLLLGSVAEHVVRRATCAVLSVKMPFADNESKA